MTLDWQPSAVQVFLIAVGLLLLFPLLKWLLWRLLSVDRRMQQLLAQKKSSEVRLGQIGEKLAPLLEDFPVNVHKPGTSTVFLGQPVDFLHIDPEEGIYFIEVKTGQSKLSASQRKIKELVEQKKVTWKQFSVN